MTRPDPLPRGTYRAFRSIPTRWIDTDIYGHVNNVVFYSWIDTAINGWLVDEGLLTVGRSEVVGLVVESGCRYLAPVHFPQTVAVGIAVETLGRSSVRYRVGLFANDTGQAAAEGFFIHVYVDASTRRPVPVPDRWRGALAELLVQ